MGELTFNHGRESTGADPLFPVPWPDAAASGSTCYKMAGIGDEAGQGEVGSIWVQRCGRRGRWSHLFYCSGRSRSRSRLSHKKIIRVIVDQRTGPSGTASLCFGPGVQTLTRMGRCGTLYLRLTI